MQIKTPGPHPARLRGDGTVPEVTPTVASERTGVRLAELVAALSLGVDLGFGQPMEHVLRQSLIALRLAERLGLDEADRSVVYYAALLVNVGCHSDAHEQAKWFGDDIALKSTKYDYELGSLRQAIASMRLVGSGNPPLHRFRVGLEFALSGHREIDGTIARHAELAGTLAAQLGLSDRRAGSDCRLLRTVGRPRLARQTCVASRSLLRRASCSYPSSPRSPTASEGWRRRSPSPGRGLVPSSTLRCRRLCAPMPARSCPGLIRQAPGRPLSPPNRPSP